MSKNNDIIKFSSFHLLNYFENSNFTNPTFSNFKVSNFSNSKLSNSIFSKFLEHALPNMFDFGNFRISKSNASNNDSVFLINLVYTNQEQWI